jgi:chloramphenicol-sensitive protein RarD
LAYALGANLVWGLLVPVYFVALADVPGLEVLAHRIIWSAVPLFGFYLARRRSPRNPVRPWRLRTGLVLGVTALLLGANWLTYIHAAATQQLVQASIGYFLAPLMTVVLSVIFLGDRLSRTQLVAVGLAVLGALNLCWSYGDLPWVALVSGGTFALYSLLRKKVALDSVTGLLAETAILLVPAGLVLAWPQSSRTQSFGSSWETTLLLLGSGGVTVAGLLAYTGAVGRLRLSTLGVVQYLAPSLNLVLSVFVYGEPVSQAQLLSFVLIWAAVVLYALDGVWRSFGVWIPSSPALPFPREIDPVGDTFLPSGATRGVCPTGLHGDQLRVRNRALAAVPGGETSTP